MINEREAEKIEEWVHRLELVVEGMQEAVRSMDAAVEDFGNNVANFEATVRKNKDYL